MNVDSRVRWQKAALGTGLLCAALVLLNACAFSPEQALVREFEQRNRLSQHLQINPGTIQVLQTVPWGDGAIYLVSAQATQDGQTSECLGVYDLQRQAGQWRVGNSGSGCGPVGGDGNPISVGGGWHRGSQDVGESHARGQVYAPEIVSVEVLWDDGESQRVEVVNNSYLAIRAGQHEFERLEALNREGEVVYTHERPEPTPGKE